MRNTTDQTFHVFSPLFHYRYRRKGAWCHLAVTESVTQFFKVVYRSLTFQKQVGAWSTLTYLQDGRQVDRLYNKDLRIIRIVCHFEY